MEDGDIHSARCYQHSAVKPIVEGMELTAIGETESLSTGTPRKLVAGTHWLVQAAAKT